jgi:hypothetical protein
METNYEKPRFCSIAAHRNVRDCADDHATDRPRSAAGIRAYARTNPTNGRSDACPRTGRHNDARADAGTGRNRHASTGTRRVDDAPSRAASGHVGPDDGTHGLEPATSTASRISALFRDCHGSMHAESCARTKHKAASSPLTLTETRG